MKNKIQKLVRENIQNLAPYTSARDEYSSKDGVFLDANENPFGSYNRYPDPQQLSLKKRLAEIKGISESTIFLGNGSDELIDLAFRIFCEPKKDKALTFTPTYGMYEVAANIHDVELIQLPLNEIFQINRTILDPYFMDSSLKLIFICSPNNPTGNLLKREDLEYILENFDGIVIVDEAYIDFCPDASMLNNLEEYPNLIICQTLSKAWGLAGLRIGMGFMNLEIINYFNKIKSPYNISSINQELALEILNNDDEYFRNITKILSEKEILIRELETLKIVRKIYPSDANFLLLELDNVDKTYLKLIEQKIIVRNRNSVIRNCVRITIGSSEENKVLITALKSISND